MTAFTRNEVAQGQILITLELRSVNHRYLDLTIRAPEDIRALEQKIRAHLSTKISRGKVELNIRTQFNGSENNSNDIHLNMALVEQLSQASESIGLHLKNLEKINPLDILRWPGVIQEQEIDTTTMQQTVMQCLDEAVNEFVQVRKGEGEKLKAMLLERCDLIEDIVRMVEKIIPTILEARKEKIRSRLAEFDFESDDKRIEQEMVLLAQKMDVSEETDRLGAHLSEVRSVLQQTKPVGRRLDFLMQELNREANTIGSKSVDTETTRASVDLKVLIEQMREQVQNIE